MLGRSIVAVGLLAAEGVRVGMGVGVSLLDGQHPSSSDMMRSICNPTTLDVKQKKDDLSIIL